MCLLYQYVIDPSVSICKRILISLHAFWVVQTVSVKTIINTTFLGTLIVIES